MGPIKVRIRGIHSTALSKHLHDKGFLIVQASDVIASRLGIEIIREPPDVTIKDVEKLPGSFMIIGSCDAVNAVEEHVLELGPAVRARSIVPLHSVYVGRAFQRGDEILVDLGGGIYGRVRGKYVLTPGSKYVVSIVGTRFHGNLVDVTLDVWLDGSYISLIPNPRIVISRHIRDLATTARLTALGNRMLERAGGYGIKFRSSARYADDNALESEFEVLLSKLREVAEAVRSFEEPTEIVRGECLTLIIPTREYRFKLHRIRNQVTPTFTAHHMIKSIVRNSPLLNLLDGVSPLCNVDEETVMRGLLPQRGEEVRLIHVKPWGDIYVLGKGRVVSSHDSELVVERQIRGKGLYDGLGVPKEVGDIALTCIDIHRKYIVHTYYNRRGQEKGTYININSDVEIVSRIVRYVDLLVDVTVSSNGEVRVVDSEEMNLIGKYYDVAEVMSTVKYVTENPQVCTYSGLRRVN